MSTGTDQALSLSVPRYPIDKVVYRPVPTTLDVPKNVSPVAPVFTTLNLINPLGYSFIIDLQLSPDGQTWYDMGNEPIYFDATFMLPFKRFTSYWSTTSTGITVAVTANDADYPTMHIRYVGVSKE